MSTDKPQKAELDHIFIWTKPDGGALRLHLEDLGLVETYRRRHQGQGTANICYCFENAFLELLWIEDETEANSAAVKRCQFVNRAKHGHRFGIAWRGALTGCATWDFKPPYLPDALAIKVSVDSDNIDHPFIFMFPGSQAPSELPPDRRGDLQTKAGFSQLELSAVMTQTGKPHAEALYKFLQNGIIHALEEDDTNGVLLKLKRAPEDARDDVFIALPLRASQQL